MKYKINEEDKLLFSQGALDYKYRLSVMKGSRIVDIIYGFHSWAPTESTVNPTSAGP